MNMVFGPVLTLMAVRTSTQVTRNMRDVDRYCRAHGDMSIVPYPFILELPRDAEPPLSWQLSDTERDGIVNAWLDSEVQESAKELVALLRPR